MKKFYLVLCLMFGFAISAFAQDRVLSGVVTDDTGESLPGVNVVVKGTTIGTITDLDGKYTIKVPEGATELVYSFIGFTSITKLIGVEKVMDITMGEDLIGLEEVVVTALGVSKSEKSLGYSVQKVEGSDMTAAREANIVNSLNGKVAGIQINNSSGAVGASTRITLRGASSIKGNNQPLFIVDGIPIDNGNYGTATSSGGFDAPNGIADINPDDIESLSVLKGPTAAALYGVRAANGVIVITTKKGTKGKGLGISFNSSTTFETPLVIPDFQNSYGQGGNADFFEWVDGSSSDGGVDESWGPPLDTGLEYVQWDSEDGQPKPWVSQPDNIKNFYDTGRTLNNNLSFTGGNEVATYRLSLGNMNQKGIVPNTDYQRYTVGGASSLRIADKVDVTFNLNYIKGQADNLPTGGYDNENPVQQMIWSGRNVNFEDLKDYENLPLSPEGTAAEGTPLNWNTVFQNNPYWVLDNNLNGIDKDRIIGGVQVKYQITDFLGVSLK